MICFCQNIIITYTNVVLRLKVACLCVIRKPLRATRPGHIIGPGLTQPSTLNWSVYRVPACLAGVKAGCVHLCRVAGNTV